MRSWSRIGNEGRDWTKDSATKNILSAAFD